MQISKELLNEVLEEDIVEVGSFNSTILEINAQRYSYKEWRKINIYELAFRTRDYFKTKNKHLSLNQSIENIFKEANSIYESLS